MNKKAPLKPVPAKPPIGYVNPVVMPTPSKKPAVIPTPVKGPAIVSPPTKGPVMSGGKPPIPTPVKGPAIVSPPTKGPVMPSKPGSNFAKPDMGRTPPISEPFRPVPPGKMAKGGKVVAASRRADGVAQRGKTKGRMI